MADPVRALAATRRETSRRPRADHHPQPPVDRSDRAGVPLRAARTRRGRGRSLRRRFGVSPPERTSTAPRARASRAALRLGPDEWLLIGPDGDGHPGARAGRCSLVDVGHRNVGLTVSGTLAAEVLSSGVMLDLDVAAFPVGMATRTLFTKAEIVLWRRAPTTSMSRSGAPSQPYLRAVLAEAAREYARA